MVAFPHSNFSIVSNPTWCSPSSCCIPVASGLKAHLSDWKSNMPADLKCVSGLQRPAHYVNGNRSNLTWTWQISHRRYTPFVQHDLNLKMAPTFFSHQYNKAPTLSVRCAFSWRKIIKQNQRKKGSPKNQRSSPSWSWHHMISFKRWVKEHSRAANVILNIVRQSLGFESWKKRRLWTVWEPLCVISLMSSCLKKSAVVLVCISATVEVFRQTWPH